MYFWLITIGYLFLKVHEIILKVFDKKVCEKVLQYQQLFLTLDLPYFIILICLDE